MRVVSSCRRVVACLCIVALPGPVLAKTTRFWNLTDNTITSLQLAPAGTDKWGDEQTKNDKDNSVDHDERLKIVGVPTGTYDARFTDSKGRKCTAKGVKVEEGQVFTIEEKQATCAP